MCNKLYVATANSGKLKEIKAILPDFEILGLCDMENAPEIIEDGKTFAENSYKKAYALFCLTKKPTIADDSGLCVDALSGAPGVNSARYSGVHGDNEANINKLLSALRDVPPERRSAKFVCDICFISESGDVFHACGEVHGSIAEEKRGDGGFGYDPVFFLPERGKTMAELTDEEKNSISHRKRALDELKKIMCKL